MSHHIVLRDAARIILPFSLFIGFFAHGPVSAAGFALCALCALSAARTGLRPAPVMADVEG